MLNSSDILRGYTDTIILAQLARGDSYGYVISKNVQEITHGDLSLKEATLYTTFRRLEAAGVIESYWGNENAGARRRYYHLTDAGRRLYEENLADWRRYRAVISELIENEEMSGSRDENHTDAAGNAADKEEQDHEQADSQPD